MLTKAQAMREARDEIGSRAHLISRKVRGSSREDLIQEGWIIALEAWDRYDPERGAWGPYLGRALAFQLLNRAMRDVLPVHAPRNREHEYLDRVKHARGSDREFILEGYGGKGMTPHPWAIMAGTSPYPDPEMAVAVREISEDLWAIVEAVHPQVRKGLEMGLGPSDMAAEFGGTAAWWGKRTSKAYARGRARGRCTPEDARTILAR